MPEMAAEAPQPTKSIIVRESMWKSRPKLLPMADPVSTIGASAPTDPPKPMVMLEAITDDQQLWPFKREWFVAIAFSTRVMPCEILSFTTCRINNDVR